MAVEFTFAPVPLDGRTIIGGNLPVLISNPTASGTLSSADVASTETAGVADFVKIYSDTAVWIALGAAPDASVAPRWFWPAGHTDVLACQEGDKVIFSAY